MPLSDCFQDHSVELVEKGDFRGMRHPVELRGRTSSGKHSFTFTSSKGSTLKNPRLKTALIGAVSIAALAVPAVAFADSDATSSGKPVPHNSDASGNSRTKERATLVRDGKYVVVTVKVKGASPGLVHAQHIHGPGMHACPGIGRDVNHDGLIDTSEGAPDYGPVVVSLTTSGDTSPASTLAVDRFPTANSNGRYTYTRKLRIGTEIPRSVAKDLDDFHIVAHGIDTNHNGMYDFSKGKSDLNPALPQEATVPATCGLIK